MQPNKLMRAAIKAGKESALARKGCAGDVINSRGNTPELLLGDESAGGAVWWSLGN